MGKHLWCALTVQTYDSPGLIQQKCYHTYTHTHTHTHTHTSEELSTSTHREILRRTDLRTLTHHVSRNRGQVWYKLSLIMKFNIFSCFASYSVKDCWCEQLIWGEQMRKCTAIHSFELVIQDVPWHWRTERCLTHFTYTAVSHYNLSSDLCWPPTNSLVQRNPGSNNLGNRLQVDRTSEAASMTPRGQSSDHHVVACPTVFTCILHLHAQDVRCAIWNYQK